MLGGFRDYLGGGVGRCLVENEWNSNDKKMKTIEEKISKKTKSILNSIKYSI